jgi:hypothetical protein
MSLVRLLSLAVSFTILGKNYYQVMNCDTLINRVTCKVNQTWGVLGPSFAKTEDEIYSKNSG